MDNTFFVDLTNSVAGTISLAFIAVLSLCVIILGAVVGYQVYKNFVGGGRLDGKQSGTWTGSGGSTHYRAPRR